MDSAPATPLANSGPTGGLEAAMHGIDNGHRGGLNGLGDMNAGLSNAHGSALAGTHSSADNSDLGGGASTNMNGGLNSGSGSAGSSGGGSSGAHTAGSAGSNGVNGLSADLSATNGTIVETPKGPPLARVATSVPGVHVAQYSNVDVLEQDVGAHTVMRRVHNGSVNATQLLKLANLDRSRRQKVLDREIGSQYEKIQGGTGKYQGTWVPLESAIDLARQYGVYEVLKPLFDFDMAFRPQIRQPTQLELDERRRELAQRNMNQPRDSHQQNHSGTPSASAVAAAAAAAANVVSLPAKRDSRDHTTDHASQGSASQGSASQNNASQGSASHSHANSHGSHSLNDSTSLVSSSGTAQTSTLAPPLATAEASTATYNDQEFDDLTTMPPVELHEGDTVAEQSRELVTELFLSANRGETSPLTEIMSSHAATEIQPDVPIDDAGHTALHWAAALGMVPLVEDLMRHGANCRRGNRKGESPLVRAVLVTNSSDNNTFGELLDLLFPCLHLGDTQGRTVLHHIALTAGIPGRSDASRYYLESLLEWAVRWRGASGVQWLVDELLDAQDANGDTALNIAARLGSKLIAQQLVDIGADVELPNRAGLKPTDFGIEPPTSSTRKSRVHSGMKEEAPFGTSTNFSAHSHGPEFMGAGAGSGSNPGSRAASVVAGHGQSESRTHSRSGSRAPVDGAEKRQELSEQTISAVKELDRRLSRELANKEQTLATAHHRLKEASEQFETLAKEKQQLEELKLRRDRARGRVEGLDAAAAHESEKFDSESAQHFSAVPVPDTSFDADEPFVVNGDEELRRLPPVLLQARINAYLQNEKQLVQLRDRLRSSSIEGEATYRKVVARCTGSEEGKVEEILDDLLTEVIRGDHANVMKGDETMEVDG